MFLKSLGKVKMIIKANSVKEACYSINKKKTGKNVYLISKQQAFLKKEEI